MAEVFNFGIGIALDEDSASKAQAQLGAIIDQVGALSSSVEAFNQATGMPAFTESTDALANSLDLVGQKASEAFSQAMGGGVIGIDPGSVEIFENMEFLLAGIGAVLVDISADTEKLSKHLGSIDPSKMKDVEDSVSAVQGALVKTADGADELCEEVSGAADCIQDSADKAKGSVEGIGDEAEDTGGSFKKFREFARQAFGEVGDLALDAADDIIDLGDVIKDLALNDAFLLERSATRLSARLGDAGMSAEGYEQAVRDMADANRISLEQADAIGNALAATGVKMSDLGDVERDVMARMHADLGLSAETMADFRGAAKLAGDSIVDMAADAQVFEKTFGVPGLLEQVPGITRNVINAQAALGKSAVKDARAASRAVTRMAGVYAKSLGKTATEAAQDAMEAFSKFAGETRNFQDVFLGLADDFSPLQTAFLEAGMGIDEMGSLMEQAQNDQVGFALRAKEMAASLDPQMAERFMQQLRRDLPEGTALLLGQSSARLEQMRIEQRQAKERARQQEEQADGQRALMEMLTGLRKNVMGTYQEFAVQVDNLTKAVIDRFGPGIRRGFENLLTILETRFLPVIKDVIKSIESGEGIFENFDDVIAKVTTGAVGFSTVAGSVAAAFGVLWKFGKPAWTLLKGLWTMFKNTKGSATGVKASVKALGKVIGKLAVPIGIAIAAFDNIKTAVVEIWGTITDDSLSAGDKIKGVFKSIGKALWGTFSDFFGGLPQRFVDGFTNVGKKTETSGSQSMGRAIGKILGKIVQVLKDGWIAIKDHFVEMWTGIVSDAQAVGGEGIMGVITGLLLKIGSGFAAVGDHILAFFRGVVVGIGEAFGMSEGEMNAFVDVVGATFQYMGDTVTITLMAAWDAISTGAAVLWHGIKEGLFGIRDRFKIVGAVIEDVFSGNFSGIRAAVLSVLGDIVGGMTSMVDGVLGTIQSMVEGLLSLPGVDKILDVDAISTSMSSARDSLTGFGRDIQNTINEAADAEERRARASESALQRMRENIEAEKTQRESAFDQEMAQYDERRRMRDQMRAESEEALGTAIDRFSGVEAAQQAADQQSQLQRQLETERAARVNARVSEMTAAATPEMVSAAAGDTAQTQQELVSTIMSLLQTAQAQRASGIVGGEQTAQSLETAARQMEIRLAASSEGADLLRRALTEFQIQQVNGSTQ